MRKENAARNEEFENDLMLKERVKGAGERWEMKNEKLHYISLTLSASTHLTYDTKNEHLTDKSSNDAKISIKSKKSF